ncbi:hypothetical protein BYT27DRAFT_7179468 [Phlegmacium glaucopus]|nr:hypothetical protein BYT27DRAFT_7179468 [Phlegmacium glaucopus]
MDHQPPPQKNAGARQCSILEIVEQQKHWHGGVGTVNVAFKNILVTITHVHNS